jgi:SAM-dependent methyltransferase
MTQQDRPSVPHDFEAMYAGTPPWDIGRPQEPFQRLADGGQLRGRVLDVGCGTGEHALMAAAAGHDATGVDTAPTAVALARDKARERGLTARFLVHDALRLADLGERFDTALDCGLFHVLDDDARVPFAASLRAALMPGARYHMLCFSDRQPGERGPRRVRREEIRATFAEGWRVDSIEPAEIDVTDGPPPILCWLATIMRL